MPAISTALAVGLGVAGAATGAVASSKAAGAQAKAATSAAALEHQDQQAALAEQQREFNTQQQNIAPWLKAGTAGINSLSSLLSTPGEGLLTPWTDTFQAPTAAQAAATPGYQFALSQGQNAIQNSAAARGGLLSTGTQKTLDQYSQGLADQTYSDTYNRALAEYQQRYNIFQGNQTNTFNRLAALSGVGQQAATTLGQEGQAAANNTANILLTGGAQQGNALMAAGNARASGYAGIANSLNSGMSNVSQYLLLSQLLGNQYQTSPAGYP
jgi:hypothetical protein